MGPAVRAALARTAEAGLTIAVVAAVWEGIVRLLRIPNYLLPSPLEIGQVMLVKWRLLLAHSIPTTLEVLLGFLLSIVVGLPLAVGIVYSPRFARVAYKLLVSSQTIPKVALAPIVVVWFGFGLTSKVVVAFLIAFFPVVISAVVGMSAMPQEMLYLARSLGASTLQTFTRFRFPGALPSIFGGLKVSITLAVVGAVVGEFIGANRGLGYLVLVATGNIDTVLVFATIVVLSAMGIGLFGLVSLCERLVVRGGAGEAGEPLRTTM
jgi:NitT/TauT family transport system permease protein